MNEPIFPPLLFASLSFLDSFFPTGLLLRKNPSARLGMLSFHSMLPLKLQGTWMVPSSYSIPFSGNRHLKGKLKTDFYILYIFLNSFCIQYLCQSMQRRISCNTFFLQSIRTSWSSIWSSTVEVPFIFIDLCRFSRVDVPPSGSENVPKPGLPPYVQVTTFCRFDYLQRNNVGQMLSAIYGSARLALFTASLTKKCV